MLASCSWAWGCPEVWLSHPVRLHWYSVFLPKVVASVCTQDIDLQFFLLWFNYFVLALEYLLQRISLEDLHLFPFYGIVCICLVLEFFFVCVCGVGIIKITVSVLLLWIGQFRCFGSETAHCKSISWGNIESNATSEGVLYTSLPLKCTPEILSSELLRDMTAAGSHNQRTAMSSSDLCLPSLGRMARVRGPAFRHTRQLSLYTHLRRP